MVSRGIPKALCTFNQFHWFNQFNQLIPFFQFHRVYGFHKIHLLHLFIHDIYLLGSSIETGRGYPSNILEKR